MNRIVNTLLVLSLGWSLSLLVGCNNKDEKESIQDLVLRNYQMEMLQEMYNASTPFPCTDTEARVHFDNLTGANFSLTFYSDNSCLSSQFSLNGGAPLADMTTSGYECIPAGSYYLGETSGAACSVGMHSFLAGSQYIIVIPLGYYQTIQESPN